MEAGLRSRKVAVRRARAADMEAVAGIDAASFANPWGADAYPELLARRDVEFLVATDGEAVTGYAVAVAAGPEAELASVAVSAERRGGGVGRALVERAGRALAERGVRTLWLAVRASNGGALRFYGRLGFEAVGADPGYYANPPDDARIMMRGLGA